VRMVRMNCWRQCRLADVVSAQLRDAALVLNRGGVGYYPSSDFVHIDTGRVRHW
jgi:uncharacterized protein YcbK (DUF882 family)